MPRPTINDQQPPSCAPHVWHHERQRHSKPSHGIRAYARHAKALRLSWLNKQCYVRQSCTHACGMHGCMSNCLLKKQTQPALEVKLPLPQSIMPPRRPYIHNITPKMTGHNTPHLTHHSHHVSCTAQAAQWQNTDLAAPQSCRPPGLTMHGCCLPALIGLCLPTWYEAKPKHQDAVGETDQN
jgi:hypothetical protein